MERSILALAIAVLCFAFSNVRADMILNDGGTYNISTTINDKILVDRLSPGMQTTVNLLAEGRITSPYGLTGLNDSRLNISGGSVIYDLWAYERNQVTMSNGWVHALLAFDSNQVTKSGGRAGVLLINGNSQERM